MYCEQLNKQIENPVFMIKMRVTNMEQTFTNYLCCVPGTRMNQDEDSKIGIFPSKNVFV